jgi:CubicO group peptidase (beta-lactamase class C family)
VLRAAAGVRGTGTPLSRAAPSEVGVDGGTLAGMLRYLSGNPGVEAVVIVRRGRVVLEAHVPPSRPGQAQALDTCTQSVTSLLTGIALRDKAIESLDRPVIEFFPGRRTADRDSPWKAITLRHLLTMQGGLDWDDTHEAPSTHEMEQSADPVQYVLDRAVNMEPGSAFRYSNGAAHLAGAILQARTGKTLGAYAQEKLFGPLGITRFSWSEGPGGLSWGSSGITLSAEDLAKLGQLLLQKGEWEGKQIIPAEWISESTRKWAETSTADASDQGYGYLWWRTASGYAAFGSGSQALFVDPDHELVAVFLGASGTDRTLPAVVMDSYVLRAVDGGGSPDADRKLRDAIAAFERQPEPSR